MLHSSASRGSSSGDVRRVHVAGCRPCPVERVLARDFGAEVRLDFLPEGAECCMRLLFAAAIVGR